MDFRKAKQQAKDLDEVADNLKKVSGKDLEEQIRQISLNWTGDNSQKFISKIGKLQGNMNDTVAALREVAQAIRQIAEVIYEAEMEAWERAHNRD